MNLPNKLTMLRIFLSIIIIAILVFPFDAMGISLYTFYVNESIVIDVKYIIAGVLFIIASLTDFLDGYIARKYNLVTDFGKMIDSIADKILTNSVLIILSSSGFIHPIIPVIIILRDTVVDSIKMIAGKKGNVVAASIWGKLKTICMMVGLCLVFFSNLPFELIGIRLDYILLIIATILSIYSGIQYFIANKDYFLEDR